MPTTLLVAIAAASGLLAWFTVRQRGHAVFYWRLYQARRAADRFYAECPTLAKDIAYQPDLTSRTLDVYSPPGAAGCPVVIYVYGGSWNSGSKTLYAPAAQRLLPEGIVMVAPDYTLYPAAVYPTPSREIAAAIAWTLDNIQHYGGDPKRVVVVAQSAGAQVAGLALLDPQFLAAHGHSAAEVRGFLGLSGVYDIETQVAHERQQRRSGQYVVDVVGGRHNLRAASPLHHVGAHAGRSLIGPPALLIHGDADPTVPLRMSQDFHARLQAAGVPSELVVYHRATHSGILFDALAQNPSRLVTDIVRFVRACTAPSA